jgi:hypothetical protein
VGTNIGSSSLDYFFSPNVADREGLLQLTSDAGAELPATFDLSHPLNSEIHDLQIINRCRTNYEVSASSGRGPTDLTDHLFYLPPFFVREAPIRRFIDDHGGVLQTPFQEIDGTTVDPFNVALSFAVAGHDVNLENFVKDLASDVDPRCLSLTASAITGTVDFETANGHLWGQPSCVKRNMLIMPCDDGNFVPGFEVLSKRPRNVVGLASNESMVSDDGLSLCKFVDSLGVQDLSLITLDNLVSTSSAVMTFEPVVLNDSGVDTQTSPLTETVIGPTPESVGLSLGPGLLNFSRNVQVALSTGVFVRSSQDVAPYTIYQRTKDPSSNEVVFFDVSNIFYGDRIYPGTLTLSDWNFSGSAEPIRVTLKDDGYGNLYRADASGSLATWNNVGNVFYDEGIVVIKSPHLFQFGKNCFNISFKGERNIHVYTIEALAPSNMLNSSSNPRYIPVSASMYANDDDKKFVYLDTINFHDENYNVVMRTQLAQPIVKRTGDKYMFRTRLDW